MSNTSSETSSTAGLTPNDVTTAGLTQNGDNSGTNGSGLAVGLSIGGVILAAILVFFVAYCFFSRRKDNGTDSDNNNVQRISMNSENFSHVTNLKKLEPLEIRNGKTIPKRTKPTLDEKREAGKADDLSDVDLSLFSGEGQLNPAFVDDEELGHSRPNNRKISSTDKDSNVVVFKLEGVVKFDVSQMAGIEKNIALSLESRTGGEVPKISTGNGEVKAVLDKDGSGRTGQGSDVPKDKSILADKQETGGPRNDVVNYEANQYNDSEYKQISKVSDSRIVTSQETVPSEGSRQFSPQYRSDQVEDVRPGTSKGKILKIHTTSVEEEDTIQVITEELPSGSQERKTMADRPETKKDPSLSSHERHLQQDKPESVAVVIEDRYVPDIASSNQSKSVSGRSFSVIEKSIDLDEEYKRRHSVRGKEVTTIFVDNNMASVRDRRRGRHDRIVFKPNQETENSSGKNEHRKRHLDNGPPLKGKDMNVPVKSESRETGKVKKSRHNPSDIPEEHTSQPYPITADTDTNKIKKVPTKPVLKREATEYEIPWDLTDVGALLMQINDIAESD
ncbi:uncharacterized protein LOC117332793 [Pecten maximus]|uniref:uncharacterized protein LOC117332793 n=1 Tax=Pecten maximus TaxID=6579 RepID=UPI0014582DB3|nr:uncharacterized protein LOC117332793 [Pecten maximus]XP_033747717.1 uncharacterized protein LOC117332793 [Pecten maximus]XP_033747718.1 uncharacterized protein LOC117332793 [Pecten maximus]XP_033747719.1 uncharacterized protein LOC117332793 [Pecten maximus]XP_033747720.1 uncharacterized protein LOC117332793 [Pecten maximus]